MSKPRATVVFTLRDLNRQPAKVLATVRKFGSALIRTRSGDLFTLSVKTDEASEGTRSGMPDFEAYWKRLRELGLVPPPASEEERIDRLIAGEA